jgi:hypothetical protein
MTKYKFYFVLWPLEWYPSVTSAQHLCIQKCEHTKKTKEPWFGDYSNRISHVSLLSSAKGGGGINSKIEKQKMCFSSKKKI